MLSCNAAGLWVAQEACLGSKCKGKLHHAEHHPEGPVPSKCLRQQSFESLQ